MARLRAWVIHVAVPLVYGQALAFALRGTFRWKLLAAAQVFGLLDQLFAVYANDVADWKTDMGNTTYSRYSGGSRVVAEGKLTPLDLARAATVALLGMAALSVYLVFREQRTFMVVIAAVLAHLLWMYSFPPFRLSYRGHGEVLQGLGLGVVLPIAGYYIQAGTLDGIAPAILAPAFLLGYAANLTTALPDAPSDAAASKRTLAVRRGERAARRASVIVIAVAILATPLAAPETGMLAWATVAVLAFASLARNLPLLGSADSTSKDLCERFVTTNVATIALVLAGWSLALAATRLAT